MEQKPEAINTEAVFLAAERDVERHSAELKKELRLFDLIWMQILNIVGLSWVGYAGRLGSSHALGSRGAGLESNKVLILGISVLVILGLMLVAWRGLAFGKWINNAGGLALMALFVGMIVVSIPRWLTGRWVTAPAIAGMFILGTAAVLAFVKPDAMDLVSPITQALTLGAPPLAVISTALLVWAAIAGACLGFNLTIRLPMVAGWDHLLPGWFSRLHPKYKTPTGSVVFLGVLTFIFAIGASAGSGNQEAFQLLDNAAGIVFALAYLVMFAIPLVARGEKAPVGVRIAAVSGGLMTVLYVVLAVFPVIDVKSPGIFTAKLVAAIVVLQVLAAGYFRYAVRVRGRRRESGGNVFLHLTIVTAC